MADSEPVDATEVDRRSPRVFASMTALQTLYEHHGSLAYSLALRMTGDPTRAEDVVETAFLQLWRGSSFAADERGSMRTRLVTLVGRAAVENIRRHQQLAGQTSSERRPDATAGRGNAEFARSG